MHGTHVLIKTNFLDEKPSSASILLEVDPTQHEDKRGFQNNGNGQCCEKEYDHLSRFVACLVLQTCSQLD